ncbi:MAG TPA: response regulator [Longimicrobiales bacterium]|nr:response regulator [Longimicrobiales bacterium]
MAINVLLIDDSAVMRAMILKSLEMSGVPLGAVHQAANGEQGLALLEEQAIDLVMLDISMPGMRGDEMLERMRAQPATAEVPVLVISSERMTERVTHMESLGAVYLPKPFLPEQLRDVVIELTGAKK